MVTLTKISLLTTADNWREQPSYIVTMANLCPHKGFYHVNFFFFIVSKLSKNWS